MAKSIDLRQLLLTATEVLFLAFPFAGTAATITWTNASGGNWSAPANWSPQQVPTSGDDVVFAVVSTLTVDVAAQANSLTMNAEGGTLAGVGPLTLGGPLSWSGGTISTVVYLNGGTIDDPTGVDGGQLINTGTLTWLPYPYTGGGSVISNAATGTINLALDNRPITQNHYGATATFYNSGQINASGSGSGAIEDIFINTGSVTVSNGVLEFDAGGTNFGTVVADGPGTVGVGGGNFYFAGGSVVSGAGNFLVSDGTANIGGVLDVTSNWTVSGGVANFTGTSSAPGVTLSISDGTANFVGPGPWTPAAVNLSGGILSGTAPVITGGPLDWTGGMINGILTCNGGTVDDPSGLDGGQLINTGTLTWIPYPFTGGGSVISNAATGTINLPLVSRPITENDYGGTATFYNSGQINASGSGAAALGDTLVNNGSFNLQSGTLEAVAGAFLEPNSTLNVSVSNAASYGTLAISGPASLGGVLNLTSAGYTPHTGDSLTPITFASETGIFSAFNLPAQADWQVVYGPSSVSFDVTGLAAPFISLGALPVSVDTNGFELLLIGPVGSNYTLEVSTNLKSWQSLTNFKTTYSSFIFDDFTSTNEMRRFYRAYIPQ
ncbi:MAG TPA: hypothetical protein VMR33_00400 [Candidatus Baltobacteraceae bacterium]|jgi:hypothetical protein|nr:hypothetical protein [Candidatus Baltobacteraceae bacterium]